MDLSRLLGILRRGWIVLLLGLIGGLGLGYAQASLTTPQYTASATS